jgi:hypothetical protein
MITDYANRFGRDLALTPRNDPQLLEPVRCRVLRTFYAGGRVVERDAVIELPRHDAVSLQAIGKVRLL